MDNIFILASFVSLIFIIFKFIEMRFINKESKPLKILIKDTLIVYLCIILGILVVQQIEPMTGSITGGAKSAPITQVFTDVPTF